jgi:hypothetical protein
LIKRFLLNRNVYYSLNLLVFYVLYYFIGKYVFYGLLPSSDQPSMAFGIFLGIFGAHSIIGEVILNIHVYNSHSKNIRWINTLIGTIVLIAGIGFIISDL